VRFDVWIGEFGTTSQQDRPPYRLGNRPQFCSQSMEAKTLAPKSLFICAEKDTNVTSIAGHEVRGNT
jgi:hypothetical protein